MEELGIDFMSDSLNDKRRIRTLNVIDHYNRKCLGIFVDFSLPSIKVIEALERVIDLYGKPKSIRTDNGSEFTSKLFTLWMHEKGIEHIRIQPGKPAQNGIVERFNRTFREDILDANIFHSIEQVQQKANEWIEEYNNVRPHQSLKYSTPSAHAA